MNAQQTQSTFWRFKMINNIKDVKGNDFKINRSSEETRELSFKSHICIGCGICESTCPVGAINLGGIANNARNKINTYFSGHDKIAQNIHTKVEKQKININEDDCVLCGMCSGVCPVGALQLTINDVPICEIEAYPHYNSFSAINDDDCIYCEKCEVACPRDAITIERKLPERKDLVTGEINIVDDECIYCGICGEMCPAEAITVDSTTGKESISVDTDKCVYCLICKKVCPEDAIKAICRSCSYGEYDIDPAKAVTKGNSIIDSELCVYCGWCQGVCPTGAATVAKPFEGDIAVDQELCQTCGACVDICPCDALAFPVSKAPGDRLDRMTFNGDYCIKCGACAKACPNGAITVKRTAINCTPTKSETWIDAINALKN